MNSTSQQMQKLPCQQQAGRLCCIRQPTCRTYAGQHTWQGTHCTRCNAHSPQDRAEPARCCNCCQHRSTRISNTQLAAAHASPCASLLKHACFRACCCSREGLLAHCGTVHAAAVSCSVQAHKLPPAHSHSTGSTATTSSHSPLTTCCQVYLRMSHL